MAKAKHETHTESPDIPGDLDCGNGLTRSIDTLPRRTVVALAQRGVNHLLGNEISSAITAFKKKNPNATESDIEAKWTELTDAKIAAMDDGTLGTRVGGPKRRGIDAIEHDVAVEMAKAVYIRKGLPWPKSGTGQSDAVDAILKVAYGNEAFASKVKAEAKRRFESTSVDNVDDFTS